MARSSSFRAFFKPTAWFVTSLVAASMLVACNDSDDDDPSVALAGAVTTARTYTRADLASLAPTTQTVAFTSGGVSQTHTYTGTPLIGLLDTAVVTVAATPKNDFLNDYVMATGTDGYRAVFALGELRTDFGNRPSLVAYSETIGADTIALTTDGFARVTSPGDVKGGRYVSNLARLDVRASGAATTTPVGGVSTSFAVSGTVLRPGTFDLTALQALPQVARTVGSVTYTGVSLWDFLNTTVGLQPDATLKNPSVAMYVVATGSDGYRALISLGEIDPGFGNQPDIIAITVNGAALGTAGFARTVVPNDGKGGRWVSNLVSLEVFTAPAAAL
ncbi:MAG: molybdopterin-binding oxidoreductase [Rhizobacter sp.]|nr:molybdopterin-binding oxidoreductase [Rhizobacter sp.]